MADVRYIISVDAGGAIKTMKEFDDTLDKTAKSSDKAETAHKGLWKQIAIGEMAYHAATKAGRAMWAFMKDSVTAAIEAEQADKALAAALEITGRPVENLATHFKNFANQLQESTIYGDEEIKIAQALLIQLTNLDKQGLDRATKGAIGLASVMGMDLNSAAQLVAKAMSGNVSALTRYGIQVDTTASKEDQRTQIMDKLEQFYGRATAETETYGGKLAQLKNKYGDIQEAVGNYITKNHALMDSLNAVASAILFQLELGERLDQQKQSVIDKENEWSDSLAKAAVEAGLQYGQMGKLIAQYKGNTVALAQAISKGKEGLELQKALKKVRADEIKQFSELQKKQRDAEKGTNKLTDATKDATKELSKHEKLMRLMPQLTKVEVATLNGEMIPAISSLGEEIGETTNELDGMQEKTKQTFDDFVTAATEAWNKYGMAAQDVIYGIDAIFTQTYRNREIAMENEYKKQVEVIENSMMSEEDKAAAMAALDEEFAAKRQELKAKQAKQDKAMSIIQTTINTFEAASKAYTLGPIIGPIMAGVITALGLALVAKIKAQPIPLARGAIFKQPTLLGGADGGSYQVAEPGSGGVEIVATPDNIRKAIGLDRGNSNGGQRIQLTVPIYIGATKIQEQIFDIIENGSQTGRLRISSRAVR